MGKMALVESTQWSLSFRDRSVARMYRTTKWSFWKNWISIEIYTCAVFLNRVNGHKCRFWNWLKRGVANEPLPLSCEELWVIAKFGSSLTGVCPAETSLESRITGFISKRQRQISQQINFTTLCFELHDSDAVFTFWDDMIFECAPDIQICLETTSRGLLFFCTPQSSAPTSSTTFPRSRTFCFPLSATRQSTRYFL